MQTINTATLLCDKKNCHTYKMSTEVLRRNARKKCVSPQSYVSIGLLQIGQSNLFAITQVGSDWEWNIGHMWFTQSNNEGKQMF